MDCVDRPRSFGERSLCLGDFTYRVSRTLVPPQDKVPASLHSIFMPPRPPPTYAHAPSPSGDAGDGKLSFEEFAKFIAPEE